jgi:phosphatidylserine decarboxylase
MKQKFRNGKLIEEKNSQDRILEVLYGTLPGRLVLKPLTLPVLSKLVGMFLSTPLSGVLIQPFIKRNNIDMTQYEPVKYKSYNDFFTRKIKSKLRPVDTNPSHFVSPCDSKLTVLPVTQNGRFVLKHTTYTVASLLKNERLAKEYEGGYAMIFRLTVDDYHRYCYVADGIKEDNVFIPGVLHTVNPLANDYFPIYKENSREYSILHTKEFGDIVMMEVGALLVGKIVNHHKKYQVLRGQEKGYFEFGGSTIVLLLEKDQVSIDNEFFENTQNGLETHVKYGEKIGVLN